MLQRKPASKKSSPLDIFYQVGMRYRRGIFLSNTREISTSSVKVSRYKEDRTPHKKRTEDNILRKLQETEVG